MGDEEVTDEWCTYYITVYEFKEPIYYYFLLQYQFANSLEYLTSLTEERQ